MDWVVYFLAFDGAIESIHGPFKDVNSSMLWANGAARARLNHLNLVNQSTKGKIDVHEYPDENCVVVSDADESESWVWQCVALIPPDVDMSGVPVTSRR